jgi:hypothetical protein
MHIGYPANYIHAKTVQIFHFYNIDFGALSGLISAFEAVRKFINGQYWITERMKMRMALPCAFSLRLVCDSNGGY